MCIKETGDAWRRRSEEGGLSGEPCNHCACYEASKRQMLATYAVEPFTGNQINEEFLGGVTRKRLWGMLLIKVQVLSLAKWAKQ